MLTTLIRRELLDNLMTFRFAAATFIMLLLVVANTFVLIIDYERRLTSHNDAVKCINVNCRRQLPIPRVKCALTDPLTR